MNKKYHIDLNENYQKELARILKAKRLEQGKSLEEVSKGICSTSYLSRLENNQVKLQDPYLKMLFEKLSINYDDLKQARKKNLFLDITKKQLLQQTMAYQETINKMIESNNYLDVEQELVLLYDNIIKGNFEEATLVMEKLDSNHYQFSQMEKLFYMYLVTLYYYSTNQINMAYRQVKVLINERIDEEVLYWVVFELSMCIHFLIGKFNTYIKDYMRFIKDAPVVYFSNHMIRHRFKSIYLDSLDDVTKAYNQMKNYYSELNMNDDKIKESYDYYLGLIYLGQNKYEEILKTLGEGNLSPRIVKLLAIAIINVENNGLYYYILKRLNNFNFSKYDEIIKNLCEYATIKVNSGNNVIKLQNFLKNKIYKMLKYSFEYTLYEAIIKEMLLFNIKCSKYKEGCFLMLNYLNKVDK